MAGCCCAEACTAAELIGIMRLPGCPFASASSGCLVSEVCWLMVDWVDCRCFLSLVFLGGARRLELSPCNIALCRLAGHVELCEYMLIRSSTVWLSPFSLFRN